jgi:hypothetical protein
MGRKEIGWKSDDCSLCRIKELYMNIGNRKNMSSHAYSTLVLILVSSHICILPRHSKTRNAAM